MVRTNVVNLTVIDAIAYRHKLPGGNTGIVIYRAGISQPGIGAISRTSGEIVPTVNTPKQHYPAEAFAEALELTRGMPYRKLGKVAKYDGAKEVEEAVVEEEAVVDTKEYEAIVNAYTDKNDKLSYDLLNRDLIQFAHRSSKVRSMISEKESVEAIRNYVVGMKFRNITNNHDLKDSQIAKMAEMLDEVSSKGVFKQLNDEIKKALKK